MILGVPSAARRMLAGLRSRWTIPCRCASWMARARASTSRRPRRGGRGVPSSRSARLPPVDVLQLDEGQAGDLADLVDLHDVRVAEPGDRLGLAQEPDVGLRVGVAPGQDHLQRERRFSRDGGRGRRPPCRPGRSRGGSRSRPGPGRTNRPEPGPVQPGRWSRRATRTASRSRTPWPPDRGCARSPRWRAPVGPDVARPMVSDSDDSTGTATVSPSRSVDSLPGMAPPPPAITAPGTLGLRGAAVNPENRLSRRSLPRQRAGPSAAVGGARSPPAERPAGPAASFFRRRSRAQGDDRSAADKVQRNER